MEQNSLDISENLKPEVEFSQESRSNLVLIIPLLVCIFFFAGFTRLNPNAREFARERITVQNGNDDAKKQKSNVNYLALLTLDQFSENLRDTVYTDKDKYLELRIDEQRVYVHYRDGSIKSYPVSSGNKFLSKGIESRPGLFAIFLKEDLHLSSQFNDAKMYHYMPFNMGIGFHSLAGTGYYGNLGVRPSSHGCIRMKAEDAKTLFMQCEIGTLVLAHRGKTARVVSFAPVGFKNEREYTKDDYMKLLAYNLSAIYEGKYFIHPPKRFIIDPGFIPRIGYNVGSSEDIPERQQVPSLINHFELTSDKMRTELAGLGSIKESLDSDIAAGFVTEEDTIPDDPGLDVSKELVNKYAYNPVGILPYFPPNK